MSHGRFCIGVAVLIRQSHFLGPSLRQPCPSRYLQAGELEADHSIHTVALIHRAPQYPIACSRQLAFVTQSRSSTSKHSFSLSPPASSELAEPSEAASQRSAFRILRGTAPELGLSASPSYSHSRSCHSSRVPQLGVGALNFKDLKRLQQLPPPTPPPC
jgi:hypothetical protein